MQSSLSRLARLLLALAIMIASGGHWAVLQTVAWTRMAVLNARHSTVGCALERTFDGRHPCQLCRSIASAKAKEKKEPKLDTPAKLLLFLEPVGPMISPLGEMEPPGAAGLVWKSMNAAPVVPPPRSLGA